MKEKKERIREITILSMFMAIIFVMTFVPYLGFITIGPLSATIIHIPVLIGAVILGKRSGIVLGLTFGVASLIRGAISGGFDFLFIFPWVSILPRFVFGLIIFDVYKFFSKFVKKRLVALAISFFVLSLIHSLLVLPMLATAFPLAMNFDGIAANIGSDVMPTIQANYNLLLIIKMLIGTFVTFSIIEAIVAAVIGSIIADRLLAFLGSNGYKYKGVKNERSN